MTTSDNLGWLVVVAIPAMMLVAVGAALGAVFRSEVLPRGQTGD